MFNLTSCSGGWSSRFSCRTGSSTCYLEEEQDQRSSLLEQEQEQEAGAAGSLAVQDQVLAWRKSKVREALPWSRRLMQQVPSKDRIKHLHG
jgi:hypothetical protein